MSRMQTTAIRLSPVRSLLAFLAVMSLVLVTLVGTAPQASAAPTFKAPWTCSVGWHASTYAGHGAVDFNNLADGSDAGKPVLASASGTATITANNGNGYGHYVDINHGGGWTTKYAHLAAVPSIVDRNGSQPGIQVNQGDYIGNVGNTGTSGGAHLHFEQRLNNVKQAVAFDGVTIPVGTSYTSSDPVHTSTNCGSSSTPNGVPARSDVDGNAGADLVIVTQETGGSAKASALLSTYQSFLSPQVWRDMSSYGWSGITPLSGDVNGDKKADLVFLTNEGSSGVKAFVSLSTGSGFQPPQLWWNGTGYGYSGIKPSLGDVDGNGAEDLILVTSQPGGGSAAIVLLSTWQGFLAPQVWWTDATVGWSGIKPLFGDMNGDKKADYVLLARASDGSSRAYVALSNGGGFGPSQLWWSGDDYGYDGIKPSLGDVDGNGGSDLVVTTLEANGSAKSLVLLSTYQSFLAPQLWRDLSSYGWSGITPLSGDVNGDKKADYVFLTDEGAGGTKAFAALSTASGFSAPQLWWNGSSYGYDGIKAILN